MTDELKPRPVTPEDMEKQYKADDDVAREILRAEADEAAEAAAKTVIEFGLRRRTTTETVTYMPLRQMTLGVQHYALLQLRDAYMECLNQDPAHAHREGWTELTEAMKASLEWPKT